MQQTIISVWAHPDDESFGPVGLIHDLHTRGLRTVLVTATQGEGGEISDPALAERDTLAQVRTAELHRAAELIGFDRVELWDYPDGGVRDADFAGLRERIIGLLMEEQPSIVLTFGPDGIYGHPDHIAISDATTQAFAQYVALHPADVPPRLYYMAPNPDTIRPNEAGTNDAPAPLPATTRIDLPQYADLKLQALHAHATQRNDWERLLDNTEWLTTTFLHRVYPPMTSDAELETALVP